MNPLCELPGLEELFDISLGAFDKERLQIFSSLHLSIHWVILNPLFCCIEWETPGLFFRSKCFCVDIYEKKQHPSPKTDNSLFGFWNYDN